MRVITDIRYKIYIQIDTANIIFDNINIYFNSADKKQTVPVKDSIKLCVYFVTFDE